MNLLLHMYQTSRNEKYARFYSSLYLKQYFFITCFFTNQKYSSSRKFKFQFSVRFSEISG